MKTLPVGVSKYRLADCLGSRSVMSVAALTALAALAAPLAPLTHPSPTPRRSPRLLRLLTGHPFPRRTVGSGRHPPAARALLEAGAPPGAFPAQPRALCECGVGCAQLKAKQVYEIYFVKTAKEVGSNCGPKPASPPGSRTKPYFVIQQVAVS